jgi:uncharacterized protein (DUF2141 family)
MKFEFLAIASLAFGLAVCGPAGAAELDLTVAGIRDVESPGKVFIGVFNSPDGFLKDERRYARAAVPVVGGTARLIFTLPPGRYAIVAFHDANDNGQLDTNILGIPTEGYAFSRDARGFMSAPTFDSAALELPESGTRATITLGY